MDNQLKTALDREQEREALKARTQAYVLARAAGRPKARHPVRWALAAAALFLVLAVEGWLYFTPVSAIGIRVNPELDLQVNCFGMVVGAKGNNPEGEMLAETVDLRFMGYTQAVEKLLASDQVQGYVQQGREVFIEVLCDDERKSCEMLANLETCAKNHQNVSCHAGRAQGHGAGHRHRHHGGQG